MVQKIVDVVLDDPVQALVSGQAEGEDRLRRNAARAEERTRIIPHLANAALATAAGLVVGLRGETGAGIITGVSTLLGGELNLWTQPGAPNQDWKDYRAMAGGRAELTTTDIYVSALPDGAKAGVRLQWCGPLLGPDAR